MNINCPDCSDVIEPECQTCHGVGYVSDGELRRVEVEGVELKAPVYTPGWESIHFRAPDDPIEPPPPILSQSELGRIYLESLRAHVAAQQVLVEAHEALFAAERAVLACGAAENAAEDAYKQSCLR